MRWRRELPPLLESPYRTRSGDVSVPLSTSRVPSHGSDLGESTAALGGTQVAAPLLDLRRSRPGQTKSDRVAQRNVLQGDVALLQRQVRVIEARWESSSLPGPTHPTACDTQVDAQYPRRMDARREIAQSRSRSPSRSPQRPRGVAPRRAQSSSPVAGPNEGRIKQQSTLPAESDTFRLDPMVAVRVHSSHLIPGGV